MSTVTQAPTGERLNRLHQHKSDLSPARRRLIELMQALNFGRLESLEVHDGEPVFDPPPRIVREIKFGGDNGPRLERQTQDFLLKSQIIELFELFDEIHHGAIEVLEIHYGLPFRVMVRASVT